MQRNQAGVYECRKGREEKKGGEGRLGVSREICIVSRNEKNLKFHHLDSRQLHKKEKRIKNPKLNQTPQNT